MKPHNIRNLLATIGMASQIKTSRSFLDLFADRIRIAANEPTIDRFIQRLIELVQASPDAVNRNHLADVLVAANAGSGAQARVLAWLRDNSALAAILAHTKREDAQAALDSITFPEIDASGTALPRKPYGIAIKATALSPISHGSDTKAGNATLFRRMQVLTTTGGRLDLPYIAGNAVRGQLRDIIADNFLSALGLAPRRDKPPVALWFFHALYAGGALSEGGKEGKAIDGLLGVGGALKTDGLRTLRDTLPMVSLLGCALTNRIISGRVEVGDLRPICREWGNGETPAHELFSWVYLTRREDHEEHEDHSGMIANTEVLKPGTVLEGGIDLSPHATEIEASCLGDALETWAKHGRIGAQNARDLGMVEIAIGGAASGDAYRAWMADHKTEILDLLSKLGALNDGLALA